MGLLSAPFPESLDDLLELLHEGAIWGATKIEARDALVPKRMKIFAEVHRHTIAAFLVPVSHGPVLSAGDVRWRKYVRHGAVESENLLDSLYEEWQMTVSLGLPSEPTLLPSSRPFSVDRLIFSRAKVEAAPFPVLLAPKQSLIAERAVDIWEEVRRKTESSVRLI